MCLIICSVSVGFFLIMVLRTVVAIRCAGRARAWPWGTASGSGRRGLVGLKVPGAPCARCSRGRAGLKRAGGVLPPHGHTVFSVESWEARKGGEVWNKDARIMLD